MIQFIEFLGILGLTGLSYIGVVVAKGGKASAIIVSVLFSIALIIYNAKLEDETGTGIVGNMYCSVVTCQSAASTPPAPDRSCEREIAAWNVMLTDYRSQEARRLSQCSQIETAQADLNSEFFALKTDWPIAITFLKDCLSKKSDSDTAEACMGAVCLGSIIGGYDCDPLQVQLRSIENRQQDYLKKFRENNCTMTGSSDYFDGLGLAYTKPVGTPPPPPPAAPACAAQGGSMGQM